MEHGLPQFMTILPEGGKNSHLYCYDQIKNSTTKRAVTSMSFVKVKNASGHYKLVYLMSLVLSSNGSNAWRTGSQHEEAINLL